VCDQYGVKERGDGGKQEDKKEILKRKPTKPKQKLNKQNRYQTEGKPEKGIDLKQNRPQNAVERKRN
jgi:hypothetical protein